MSRTRPLTAESVPQAWTRALPKGQQTKTAIVDTALRTALLTNAQGKANEVSERMVVPGSLLGVVFIALLVTPPLLRLLTS